MKILFLSHLFPNIKRPLDGVFIYEKAKALRNFVETTVVAPLPYVPFCKNFKGFANIEQYKGIVVERPKYLTFPDFMFSYRWFTYFKAVMKLLKMNNFKFDIINVEWVYPDCYAAIIIARELKKKIIVTVHGNEALGCFDPGWKRRKYVWALMNVDHIIAVSNDMKTKMVSQYKIPNSKISVLPNGINPQDFFLLDPHEARMRLQLHNSKHYKVLICVARLSEEKALETMIEAISFVKDKVLLFILGDGPQKLLLSNLINKLNLGNSVYLKGAIPHKDINLWLNAADFFCLSSRREGCPVVIHEALACGIPVLSTNVGGIPDIINSAQYGMLCDPDQPREFANMIMRALQTQWDKKTISDYGQGYTWNNLAEKLVGIYKKVLY